MIETQDMVFPTENSKVRESVTAQFAAHNVIAVKFLKRDRVLLKRVLTHTLVTQVDLAPNFLPNLFWWTLSRHKEPYQNNPHPP